MQETNENTAVSLEEVRERFSHDRFATVNGAVVEAVEDGYARCSMELNETHRNALGAVMGGAIFTLADFAFAVASNWNKEPSVSLTASISFLGKAKGSRLIAEACRIKEGRKTCYYEITIRDELGSQVAHMTSNGFTV
ncbi:MAG: PaaI family thioesterase [Lachnospiraceae bacterium]|nr:PaaI family thioesterase [Lachnospiraceae bacterium]MBO5145265.1 PaaI family thioesterase [Lachnospiraceae bacterium]